jgi:tRNA threonylcarbamoyladenosine biosynthesis protein TsaB
MAKLTRAIAIDSSGLEQAIVLLEGGSPEPIRSDHWRRERSGADRTLLERAQQLLKSAGWNVGELSAVVAGRGPGSFTGLRVGLSVAEGLSFGLEVPLFLVDSLPILAAQGGRTAGALRDAGRREVYAWRPGVRVERLAVDRLGLWMPRDLQFVVEPAGALAKWSLNHAEQEIVERLPFAQALALIATDALSRGKPVRYHEIEPLYAQPAAAQERKEAEL